MLESKEKIVFNLFWVTFNLFLNCMHTKEENLDKRSTALNQESMDTLEGSKMYALVACRSVLMDIFLKIELSSDFSKCLKKYEMS